MREQQGGHSFPRPAPSSPRKVRHTLVPTLSYDPATTSKILKVCKAHSTTLSNAVFALCNIAWIRSSGIEEAREKGLRGRGAEEVETSLLPINIYSAVNVRGIFMEWGEPKKEGEEKDWYALAIGYYK